MLSREIALKNNHYYYYYCWCGSSLLSVYLILVHKNMKLIANVIHYYTTGNVHINCIGKSIVNY